MKWSQYQYTTMALISTEGTKAHYKRQFSSILTPISLSKYKKLETLIRWHTVDSCLTYSGLMKNGVCQLFLKFAYWVTEFWIRWPDYIAFSQDIYYIIQSSSESTRGSTSCVYSRYLLHYSVIIRVRQRIHLLWCGWFVFLFLFFLSFPSVHLIRHGAVLFIAVTQLPETQINTLTYCALGDVALILKCIVMITFMRISSAILSSGERHRGVGLLRRFLPFRYFPNFSTSPNTC